jgi:SAM-dependent methyltransferase
MTDAPWWPALYDDLLAEVLLDRDESDPHTQQTLRFLLDQLGLTPGARVLDQCCGVGSLSLALARLGFEVIGVDQATSYIDRARAEATRAGLAIELHAADAAVFVPREPVDGAFNWWTSFGYADTDADNQRMLACAFASLKPGGVFLLDVMNLPGVLRGFQRDVFVRRETTRGEVLLLRETSLDLAGGFMDKRWTYFLPDGSRVEHTSHVPLYMPHQIVRMLRDVGFAEISLFSGPDGAPLSLDSLRLIVRARRPA